MEINKVWCQLLSDILSKGSEIDPRNLSTKEILGHQTRIDMNQPVLTVLDRKMGYRFMCAEAWWILSGQNKVETISPYSKAISNFSDNGITFSGAYGPKIIDQLQYVVECFQEDINTRQAVEIIWRENPRKSKDIPCTVSVQFLIRNGKLYCIDTMRSSDAWLGWVYDVFNFSCLSMWIILALRKVGINVELGDLILTAGSQHLYSNNFEKAESIISKFAARHTMDDIESFDISPVDLDKFDKPDDLVKYLKYIADFDNEQSVTILTKCHWMKELPHVDLKTHI